MGRRCVAACGVVVPPAGKKRPHTLVVRQRKGEESKKLGHPPRLFSGVSQKTHREPSIPQLDGHRSTPPKGVVGVGRLSEQRDAEYAKNLSAFFFGGERRLERRTMGHRHTDRHTDKAEGTGDKASPCLPPEQQGATRKKIALVPRKGWQCVYLCLSSSFLDLFSPSLVHSRGLSMALLSRLLSQPSR